MLLSKKAPVTILALCVTLLPLLAGCGTDNTPTAPAAAGATSTTASSGAGATDTPATSNTIGDSGASTTLTFWNGFTGSDLPGIQAVTKKFTDANPNIKVDMDVQPWDTLMQKLLSSMSTGTGPDVVAIHFQYIPQYAKSGLVMDLSSEVKAGGDLDPSVWPSALNDLLQYDGKYYATPLNYATLMMYYHKDLFTAAGITAPPTNWDEWQTDIKKLTKADGSQYGIAFGEHDTIPNYPILIWENGGDIVKDGKPALSSPESVSALKTWTDMVKNDKISPVGLSGAESDKLFETGKAAMEITGPWATSGYDKDGFDYDVAPIPAGPAGAFTLADTVVLMVNAKTQNKDAAIQFIKHWNSKDSQVTLSSMTGFPPTRTDLASDPTLAKNKWVPKFASVAPQSRFYLPGLEKFSQIDTDVFVPMIQSITLGKATVEDATKNADQQITDLLK
ncbi:MAG TPA: ABC transporter substrate-binding protein [Chloroflexia bacterium]|nr:ABC transporter substrate-binding protein [Chloroflexia bacterium]